MTKESSEQQTLNADDAELSDAEPSAEFCRNCGAALGGEYCAQCGQSRRHFLRFFPSVVGDFIAETFEIDGRLSRTLRTLLLQPGKLTNEYLAGRRVYYSPPARFYLFSSLIAFLLISIEADRNINFANTPERLDTTIEENIRDASDSTSDQTANDKPDPAIDVAAKTTATRPGEQTDAAGSAQDSNDFLWFNDQPWHPQHNPIQIGLLPASANTLLNQRVARIQDNIPRIKENPGLLVDQFLRYLPQTMLVLLPVFALILKLFYPLARRYYTEHVIFSIHIHSFTMLMVIIIMLLEEIEQFSPLAWLDTGLNSLAVIAMLWVPVYGMLAQKHVYCQGWIVTSIKYLLVYGVYFTVQMLVLVFVILLGASSL